MLGQYAISRNLVEGVPMKTMLSVLAAGALLASGAALACDDRSHHADAQAKAADKDVVATEKVAASQPATKPAAKQKAPVKSVAQGPATRTVAN
jgi:hypothetical protein